MMMKVEKGKARKSIRKKGGDRRIKQDEKIMKKVEKGKARSSIRRKER